MSSHELIPSIDKRDFSFDGASRMNFIANYAPWRLSLDEPLEIDGDPRAVQFPLCSPDDRLQMYLNVCMTEDTQSLSLTSEEVYRLYYHWLGQDIPDGGLEEAVTDIEGIIEFHKNRPPLPPQPIPPQKVPARIVRSYVEPVYPIPED